MQEEPTLFWSSFLEDGIWCFTVLLRKNFTDMNAIFPQLLPFFDSTDRSPWQGSTGNGFCFNKVKLSPFHLFGCTDSVPFSHHYQFLSFFANLYPACSLLLDNLLFRFDAVVHFAGLKAVGESVQKPLLYYDNNVIGTVNLLEVMSAHGCKKVFTILHIIFLLEPPF